MATIGGNICNASPCANFTNVLMALEASIKIRGEKGERQIALIDFYTGPGLTSLKPFEIITEVVVPGIPVTYGASYIKHTLQKTEQRLWSL